MLIPAHASKETLVELCCDWSFWGERLGGDAGHDRLPRLLHMPKDGEEEKRTPPPPSQGPAAASHNLSAMQPRTLAFTALPLPAEATRDGDGDGDVDASKKEGVDALPSLSSIRASQGVKRGGTESAFDGQEEEVAGVKDIREMLQNMTERYRKVRREREADELEMEGLRVMAVAEEERVKECRGFVEAAERDVMEAEKQKKGLEEARDMRRKVLSQVEMGAATLTTKLEGMQKVLIRSMEREIEVGDAQTDLEDLVNFEQANLNKRARKGNGSNRIAGGNQKAYAQRR